MKTALVILLLCAAVLAQTPSVSPIRSANIWCAGTKTTGCNISAVNASLKTTVNVTVDKNQTRYTWATNTTASKAVLLVRFEDANVTVSQAGKLIKPSDTGVYDLSFVKGEVTVTKK